MRRKVQKTKAQKRKQAKERAARELAETIKRFGLNKRQPSRGIKPDPLAAKSFVRRPKLPSTSNRIPGSAPASDLLNAHKWRRGAEEKEVTIKEMQLKRARIAPLITRMPCSICHLVSTNRIRPWRPRAGLAPAHAYGRDAPEIDQCSA